MDGFHEVLVACFQVGNRRVVFHRVQIQAQGDLLHAPRESILYLFTALPGDFRTADSHRILNAFCTGFNGVELPFHNYEVLGFAVRCNVEEGALAVQSGIRDIFGAILCVVCAAEKESIQLLKKGHLRYK